MKTKEVEKKETAKSQEPTLAEEWPPLPEPEKPQTAINGVIIGTVDAVDSSAELTVRVVYPGMPGCDAIPARLLCSSVLEEDSEVALLFEEGDPSKPLIVGPIQNPVVKAQADSAEIPEVLNLKAKEKITLTCGRSTITLTKSGKILTRGAYVSSRSSGANKVKGASVQIN